MVGVNNAISGCAVTSTNSALGSVVEVGWLITGGTFVTVGIDWGDNITIFISFCEEPELNIEHKLNHTYDQGE